MARTSNGCWITTVVSAECQCCHERPEIIHVNPPARGETVFYCRECCPLCRPSGASTEGKAA